MFPPKKSGFYGIRRTQVTSTTAEDSICRLTVPKLNHQPMPPEINSVWDIVAHASRSYSDHKALGWRDTVQVIGEYIELSDYRWMTYKDFTIASSEISLGLIGFDISTGDCFNLYAPTSPNWQLMYHGCTSISITVATSDADDIQGSDDTQQVEGLTHSLNEPGCVGVFTNARLLPTLLRALPRTSTVKLVVYDGKPDDEDLEAVRGRPIRVMSIDELRNLGRAGSAADLEERSPKKEDVAMIAYTRSSGQKGLILTHTNLLASIGAVGVLIQPWTRGDSDKYLSSLPHAHVLLAFVFELFFLFKRVPIGYGRAQTLADSSVRNCKGDICALSPSIMVADPGFWEIIQEAIMNKMSARGRLKKTLFRGSAWSKKQNIPVLTQLGDLFVFYALREATGGHLRIAVSVGGRINSRTREFLSAVLVTVIDGYTGSDTATSTVLPSKHRQPNAVKRLRDEGLLYRDTATTSSILPSELRQYAVGILPVRSIEIKLLDVPGWTDGLPKEGEVCIRGPIPSGYYKSDETVFTKDGWLRTGDIGRWNTNGTLSRMDWLKLIKLESDEHLANRRIGAIYEKCSLVHSLYLYKRKGVEQPIAVIKPHASAIDEYLAKKMYYSNHGVGDLCEDPAICEIVRNECNLIGEKNRLGPSDLLLAVILTRSIRNPLDDLDYDEAQMAKALKVQIDGAFVPTLEDFENSLKSSNRVDNPCLDTKLKPKQVAAIVVPRLDGLKAYLDRHAVGHPGLKAVLDQKNSKRELERLCQRSLIQDIIKRECNSIGEGNGLQPFELLRVVILTPKSLWTSQNDHVTTVQIGQHHEILPAFKAQMNEVQRPALERLEVIFKTCDLVDNIFVYASWEPQQPTPIVSRQQGLKEHLDETKNSAREFEMLGKNPAAMKNGFNKTFPASKTQSHDVDNSSLIEEISRTQ